MKIDNEYLRYLPIDIQSLLLLKSGQKPCIRFCIGKSEIARTILYARRLGLKVHIKEFRELNGRSFSSPVVSAYFSLSLDKAKEAWESEVRGDRKEFGRILGYPECCVDAFIDRLEIEDDWTRLIAANTPGEASMYCNNLFVCDSKIPHEKMMRPEIAGMFDKVRSLFLIRHVPCSFSCRESIETGKKTLSLLREHDPNLAERIVETLSKPVLYLDSLRWAIFEGKVCDGTLNYGKVLPVESLLEKETREALLIGNRIEIKGHNAVIMNGEKVLKEVSGRPILIDFI